MSPANSHPTCIIPSFPRVSGDEPLTVGDTSVSFMFSPRERG